MAATLCLLGLQQFATRCAPPVRMSLGDVFVYIPTIPSAESVEFVFRIMSVLERYHVFYLSACNLRHRHVLVFPVGSSHRSRLGAGRQVHVARLHAPQQ